MAELNVYCGACRKRTTHRYVGGRLCKCGECGGDTRLHKEPAGLEYIELQEESTGGSMKTRKRLSEQEVADIIRRRDELNADWQQLAEDFGVSVATAKKAYKKGGGMPGKPGRKAGRPKGDAHVPAAAPGKLLREAIVQRVAAEVEIKLAELDLDARIEAALARMLK